MAHAQKPGFVFLQNGRVHLNRQGRQFSRLLTAEVCASAVVMLDTPCSEVVCRVLASHFNRQFPLHFPSRASPCAITFRLDSTYSPEVLYWNVYFILLHLMYSRWLQLYLLLLYSVDALIAVTHKIRRGFVMRKAEPCIIQSVSRL